MDNLAHRPVLLERVLERLAPVAGGAFVDATFGGGGYGLALLAGGARSVLGIDRDPDAVARGRDLAATEPRLTILEGRFGDLAALVPEPVDGIVFDLGVSSFQLDDAARGFSFRLDGPLDMRMGADGPTAADLVNGLDSGELASLFRRYGEEPKARRAAAAIVRRRQERPFVRTGDLAEVVRRAVAVGPLAEARIDPATRIFQALRIAVNDELGELERGLEAAMDRLLPGGRLVVVAFQSLEDRIVKRFLRQAAGREPGVSRHRPEPAAAPVRLALEGLKPILPTADEIEANPRARSARLRWARRVEV